MIDHSFFDLRLLFPNITDAWVTAIESVSTVWDLVSIFLMVTAEWRLFKKFGEKPWKSLIMYYNSYILYKHTWGKKPFWIYFVTSSLFSIMKNASEYLSKNQPDNVWMTLLLLLSLPFGIAATVCSILYAFRLAEAFGKGKLFSIGLLLVYPVFISILGFGNVPYVCNCNADQKGSETEAPEIGGEVVS